MEAILSCDRLSAVFVLKLFIVTGNITAITVERPASACSPGHLSLVSCLSQTTSPASRLTSHFSPFTFASIYVKKGWQRSHHLALDMC